MLCACRVLLGRISRISKPIQHAPLVSLDKDQLKVPRNALAVVQGLTRLEEQTV